MSRATRIFLVAAAYLAALLLLSFFLATSVARAQASAPADLCSAPDAGVTVQLSAEISKATPDVPVGITANINNANSYAVTDGVVYVRVYKVLSKTAAGASTLVDEFSAVKNISLPVGSSTSRTFVWRVPYGVDTSLLRIAATFASAQHPWVAPAALPAAGAPGTLDLSVKSSVTGNVSFDKKSVKVGTTPYTFAVDPLQVAASESIPLSAVAANNTKKPQQATVHWNVFPFENMPGTDAVSSREAALPIRPNSTSTSSYVIPAGYPAYFVEGVLEGGGARDVVGVAIARAGVSDAHVAGVSASSYPLTKDGTISVCVRGADANETGTVDVNVIQKGSLGSVIAVGSYEGSLSHAITIPLEKVQADALKDFDVSVQLRDNSGKTASSQVAHYSCKDLGGSDCPQYVLESSSGGSLAAFVSSILVAIIALIGIGLLWKYKSHWLVQKDQQ